MCHIIEQGTVHDMHRNEVNHGNTKCTTKILDYILFITKISAIYQLDEPFSSASSNASFKAGKTWLLKDPNYESKTCNESHTTPLQSSGTVYPRYYIARTWIFRPRVGS